MYVKFDKIYLVYLEILDLLTDIQLNNKMEIILCGTFHPSKELPWAK